jgi:hypothetical protein
MVINSPISLLIIGHFDDAEFTLARALSELNDVTIEQTCRFADYWRTAPPADGAGSPPDLIVMLERHPDEHSRQDVRGLIEQHPLARIVCGGLAITADRSDAFESRYAASQMERIDWGGMSLKVAIDVPDAEYCAMIEKELLPRFAEVVDRAEQWDVLVFDAHPEAYRLRELRRLLAPRLHSAGRIIILHELPGASICEKWSSEELATSVEVQVVSKLAPLSHLASALREAAT